MSDVRPHIIPPEIYTREYYLTDNEGHKEYRDLDRCLHHKFSRALRLANIRPGEHVLDAGCGRGELVYYAIKHGAVHALGIDYSRAAVEIARETVKKLPEHLQGAAEAHQGTAEDFHYTKKYDVIFFLEIAEHMYDWQLEQAFQKFHDILNPNGRLIVITPNYLYEQILQPVKLWLGIPGNSFKWALRIIQDKYEPESFLDFLKKIGKWRVDRGETSRKMHCNVLTPGRMKKLLSNFNVTVYCEDTSKNFLSMLMKKWWGRDIIVIAAKTDQ